MEEPKANVRAVERALEILLCFTDATDLGLSEISNRLSLHKSTVHRLLATLENKGFLIRDVQTEKYRLGFRVWELSANLTHDDDPATLLLPEMERLRDLVEETISLYVRDGYERIRIQAVQSKQPIRRVAPVGARMPLTVGASSKVLVAHTEPHDMHAILEGLEWPDYVDRGTYMEQLESIRQQGFATSVEERELGTAAVAAPIFNRNGQLIAAIAASGPSNRLTQEKMKQYAPYIMETAYRMGKMMK
jgi:IclR family transcriptional regulator, KDG regulon repressor